LIGGMNGFAGSARNQSTVYDSVRFLMRTRMLTHPPTSFLDAIHKMMIPKVSAAKGQLEREEQQGKTQQAEATRTRLARLISAVSILGEMVNQAEQHAITIRIQAEDTMRSKGAPLGLLEDTFQSKFAELHRLIEESKANGVKAIVVQSPQTLGDDYEELIQNLDRLSDAKLAVLIVPPSDREPSAPPSL
jgi:hypothetical protein